jgi:hypothetical protein
MLGNMTDKGFETEQREKLEKRMKKLEARVEILERAMIPDQEKQALIDEAVSLKVAAPSVVARWSVEKLTAAIMEAKK